MVGHCWLNCKYSLMTNFVMTCDLFYWLVCKLKWKLFRWSFKCIWNILIRIDACQNSVLHIICLAKYMNCEVKLKFLEFYNWRKNLNSWSLECKRGHKFKKIDIYWGRLFEFIIKENMSIGHINSHLMSYPFLPEDNYVSRFFKG